MAESKEEQSGQQNGYLNEKIRISVLKRQITGKSINN
jgi:hypothetical protein